jgi:hypothetical protein
MKFYLYNTNILLTYKSEHLSITIQLLTSKLTELLDQLTCNLTTKLTELLDQLTCNLTTKLTELLDQLT